jgi:hypothetical protein
MSDMARIPLELGLRADANWFHDARRTTGRSFAVNPIPRRFGSGCFIKPRIASKTTLNWRSYLFSSSNNLPAKPLCLETDSRNRTKARMISMFT